ncbi:hypothetical protein FDA94_03335 [Herbidospora galbida]|uniref:Uncharacterized protein n=1 Tax=Herbidospora galbida TaxID=2575442 RepID=A0A4U3MMR3_9ACTN|nr:hypothetical protein [Herbidospora galbida]TKK90811.1 hypothetical protein FDA94_03335 [Herbidospora galbida]
MADLDQAVDALYTAFSRYPLPAETDACDHCVSPEQVRATRAAPLRVLTASALAPYAGNALSTWGDVDEFRHFLPRILELLVLEELDGWYADVVLDRLGARWDDWRPREREAIIAVVGAWWNRTLNHYPRDVDVMKMIEIIAASLGLDLAPYLAAWEANTTEPAARHLAWLLHDYTVASGHGAEWYALLTDWIMGPAPAAILERAFFSAGSPEVARTLSDALETHRVVSAETPGAGAG